MGNATIDAKGTKRVHVSCPHDCPDGCSMSVTVDLESGKAIRVEGDKTHPVTQGFLCGKVNSYLDYVYNDQRVLYPQRRVGPKGPGAKCCLLYTSPSPRDRTRSRMPSSA